MPSTKTVAEMPLLAKALQLAPANTVVVVMSNDETAATEAWKILRAESVNNVYILEGGINNWLTIFANPEWQAAQGAAGVAGDEPLRYAFTAALGSQYPWASPVPENFELVYTRSKIKLELKRSPVVAWIRRFSILGLGILEEVAEVSERCNPCRVLSFVANGLGTGRSPTLLIFVVRPPYTLGKEFEIRNRVS